MIEDFRPKVTAITESKDVDSVPVDELVGSLQSYELNLSKTNKFKSMAIKSVDDVDENGFDDELSATEITYLVKNFRNFLRITTEGQKVKTMLNLGILRGMNQLK